MSRSPGFLLKALGTHVGDTVNPMVTSAVSIHLAHEMPLTHKTLWFRNSEKQKKGPHVAAEKDQWVKAHPFGRCILSPNVWKKILVTEDS